MLVSYFSPTHNIHYLKRAELSLRQQTNQNFEWVIVPNGPVSPADIKVDLPQAKIVKYSGDTSNIGELKHFACQHCTGDIVAEFDHDDELSPDCTEELVKAFADKTDFAYSNWAEFKDNYPYHFNGRFGWINKPFLYDGEVVSVKSTRTGLTESFAFPPTPDSFCKIWYAPNHIRAWRKSFYFNVGGHNKDLRVADDHDLCCRSYIHGNVKHIEKCLYIYHQHSNNSFRGELNAEIQTRTVEFHDKYSEAMVAKWSQMNNLKKVSLLSGRQGYETLPFQEQFPYEDNSVGLFVAQDALQKFSSPINLMAEIHRCLAPGGWLISETPSTEGRGAFQDPTQKSYWNENSFWYYAKEQHRYIKSSFSKPIRFLLSRSRTYFPSEWHKINNICYVRADLIKHHPRIAGLMEM